MILDAHLDTRALAELAPWMHPFKLGDDTYVGAFKYHGIAETFCTPDSPPELRARFAAAFDAYERGEPFAHLDAALAAAGVDLADSTVLDIASATGRFSMALAKRGARQVLGVEIREEQVKQATLLTLADDRLLASPLLFEHDPTSADDPRFREGETHDVVLSFGLLCELTDPLQHARNLARLARRVVILQTPVHFGPDGWLPRWAERGAGWTPPADGPAELLRAEGLDVQVVLDPRVAWAQRLMLATRPLPRLARGAARLPVRRALPSMLRRGANPMYLAYVGVKR